VANRLLDSLTAEVRRRNDACYDKKFTMSAATIRENLLRIRERIALAAKGAGRGNEQITLIGVSKTRPAADIREAFEAGLIQFGENRVQEWEGKRDEIAELPARWHLIGHLQSNKAARAARLFHSVDSVDSIALAERLDRAREEFSPPERLRVLIEVHIAGEESKSGAAILELPALAERLLQLHNLHFAGLMCIPPYLEDVEAVRPYFAKLRELRDTLQSQLRHELPALSMGMSHDFEAAVAEGATEVRVGTALFGARAMAQ
jgi:pyridoxal phosphate enzyme (YggS family)